MDDIFCESTYGGGQGYENWHPHQENDSQKPEEPVDDEVDEKLIETEKAERTSIEVMEALPEFNDLMKLWAEIIEIGVSLDPAKLAAMRQQAGILIMSLGLTGEDGNVDIDKLIDFSVLVARYKELPIKKNDYPKRKQFIKGVNLAIVDNPELFDNLDGRDGKDIGDYLYGLGMVMDTQLVYENIFENDPIVVGKRGQIENGRHRVAVLETFNRCDYVRSRPWIIKIGE